MTSRHSRRPGGHRPLAAPLLALALLVGGSACSGDSDESTVLDQVAPTKSDVAREAGISFPVSTTGFRLVRVTGDQLDVTFTIDAADVSAFASGSGITLTDGERAITHASPLWEVAVAGAVSGGSSTEDGIERNAEVVPDGDHAIVRLTVLKK